MTERLTFATGLSIVGFASLAPSGYDDVQAYDVIDAVIPHTGTQLSPGHLGSPGRTNVDIQPSGTGKVKALIITSDNYAALDFKVDSGVTTYVLDQPLILVTAQQLALFGATCKILKFLNSGVTNDANLRILVGRDAVE